MTARRRAEVAAALAEQGWALPPVNANLGQYRGAVHAAGLVWTSGQLPLRDGTPVVRGRVGSAGLPTPEAAQAATVSALGMVAAAFSAVPEGSAIEPVKMVVFVAALEGFTDMPQVADGASAVLAAGFGSVPARSAVGVASLPLGVPVEIDGTFEVAGAQ